MVASPSFKNSAEFDAWKKLAQARAAANATMTDLNRENLRRILVELNALFLSAPGQVQKAYRALDDARITKQGTKFSDALMGGSIKWSLPEDPEEIAAVMGGMIRAVDWTLGQYRSQWPGDASQWLLDDHYVIPRDGLAIARPLSQGQLYERRGLVFHRVIPKEIDGYSVEVFNGRTLHLSAEKDNWKMGACLFEKVDLKPTFSEQPGEKRFVISQAVSPSADAVVADQIARSLDEGCVALVWPELTVPPELRNWIQALLQNRDVADSRPPPEVVVAGTWHETTSEGIVNRACIYDGYGMERLAYDKIAAFAVGSWGKEDIIPGKRLCVLATEAALIGFAICLDFCDAGSNPFTRLDVDLMLVPSLGNDRTMEGHQTTAAQVEVKFGTRSFVVQHMTETEFEDGRLGTILPMSKRPNRVSVEHLGQKTVWQAYKWSGKS